jgi:hypothetical protein
MATKAIKSREVPAGQFVQGRSLVKLGAGVVLVQTSPSGKKPPARPEDGAAVLVNKAWKALKKPGISKQAVFRNASSGVFAYSVYPQDTTKVVREAADGTRTIGRLVGGRFQATKTA